MKNKGFTLIELLVVVVILGILATIFVPSVLDLLSSNSTKIYASKEKIVSNAAKDYVILNDDFVMPDGVTPEKYITIATMVNANVMADVLDNTTTSPCIGFVKITVNSVNGYDYDPCLICDSYTTNKAFCTSATYNSI